MMWLHRIRLNIDHPGARRDVADPYQMHKTLTRAFVEGAADTPPRFLWRQEETAEAYGIVLIQSERRGEFKNIDNGTREYLLTTEIKEFVPEQFVHVDEIYHFRLRANPTVTRAGKRYALFREDEQLDWLRRQGETHGFQLLQCICSNARKVQMRKGGSDGHRVTIGAVTFDGILRVTDASAVASLIANGVGHAKSFGLGLLSLAHGR